jgi:hypothetical protein
MSDIVERLRNWRTVHLTQLRYVMESAADEIERLRGQLSGSGNQVETRQSTLTDEEREAVEVAAAAYADDHGERFAATLRALLERTK